MQGLPVNLLAQNVAPATGKTDAAASVNANGKVAGVIGQNKEGKEAEQGAFASLFGNLLGNSETKSAEGSAQPQTLKGEVATETKASNSEAKVDALLKNKSQEQDKKTEQTALTTEQALSPEVLKNIDGLLAKTQVSAEGQKGAPVKGEALDGKITSASTNLDQLLKTLKGEEGNVQGVEGETLQNTNSKETKNNKGSALDFLIKESKSKDVGSAAVTTEKVLATNPESVSKLGLSSEDFIKNMTEAKAEKAPAQLVGDAALDFDPKALMQKQLNQSMKAYGQKQNLLSDNVIRNTKDLAFKETKPKSVIDELKNPDLKIGAETAMVKEQFIPLMQQKQEMGQNMQTQNSGKVLDLSKMNASNTEEVIKRISDYVQQSQVANQDSIDLTVKHDALGQFKIQVTKPTIPGSNQMDMQITTSTAEGHEFFMKNETGLLKNLSQAGIQLSDLRIVSGGESSSFAQNDSRQSGNSQYNQAPKEFMSFDSGDSSNGSQRRRELWQEARDNQQRYGA
ncbi:hypothetical protein DOM21_16805 [Bacteriovorax stolpii]|uniref:hypothetical protein n=1 Tax=Bacteriovorax stolpii TaxID=960 RepID=UPI001157E871|nr:hypothetical protein [Bacteriovorax stolpii]QDK43085.1 hypothetical protein DOM21_16805 [Bacteriovorax stolpii]